MTVAFASAVVFVCSARYTKKETVLGAVFPAEGVTKVAPLRAGAIKEVLISSGEVVKKGQPLFAVSYDLTLETGETLAGRINETTQSQIRSTEHQGQLRKAQLEFEKAALDARVDGLTADVSLYQKQEAIQAERVTLLENTVTSSRELYEKKFMSAVQLRQREDALLQAKQNLAQITQSIRQAQSQIQQVSRQANAMTAQIAASSAELALDRARMKEKQFNDRSTQGGFIVASRSGRIASLQARAGEVIAPNQMLALIVPDERGSTQVVHLWAPSRAIGFVKQGAKVRLMFDAFPYQTFGVGGGRVMEVSSAPVMPNELPLPIETREQMYKVVVALDRNDLTAYGRSWPLVPGMRLTADLILDERSLMEWLLDPLIAMKKRSNDE